MLESMHKGLNSQRSQSTDLTTQYLFRYMILRLRLLAILCNLVFFDDEVMFVMKDSILRTGDICIVQLNSQYHVMKVSQNRENGDFLLNSLNSDESPNTLSEKYNFTIFGKVVLM
ncbi:S24 family peptidase [Streptococcus salivarius]|uniref:S24 family peptidase n=1 Tax=Streptococcus salivarius TaxID=1304 RepID=UPI002FD85667